MAHDKVIRSAEDLSTELLSRVLGRPVLRFETTLQKGNWSTQVPLKVHFVDGATHALRLKICLGETFGRSEVDFYTRDYVGLADPPLVRCHDARHEVNVGYHLLLDDLAATHRDRRDVRPTLEYGLAVAEALGRLHGHRWESQPTPGVAGLDRYFAEIRPGIEVIERATGLAFGKRFQAHEVALRARWANSHGMSLLHGDLNPTNVLTPRAAEFPVYFLDRQPFDWSLTYGVAAYDLAYFLAPWWPEELLRTQQATLLRRWHDAVDRQSYSWEEAQADWNLSVEQCLHVPIEWCSKPDTVTRMRWLWERQLARVQVAIASAHDPCGAGSLPRSS